MNSSKNKPPINHGIDINEAVIQELISKNSNLNFTGHDKDDGASSPLTYCIYHDKKELFIQLIKAGADINYKIERFDWSAITYAIRYATDEYLKILLQQQNLDLNIKVNNSNPIEHALNSVMSYQNIGIDEFSKRLKLIFTKLDALNIDPKEYFNKDAVMWQNFISTSHGANMLMNNFPTAWLKNIFNSEYFQDKGLYILNLLNVVDKSTLTKVIKLMDKDYRYDNGKNLLHYYLLNMQPSGQPHKCLEHVIVGLLDAGFDPHIKNIKGKNAHEVLLDYDFYKDYCTKKNYEKLEKDLTQEKSHNNRKMKL